MVDNRIYKRSADFLIKSGYSLVNIQRVSGFDLPISSHPDIFVTKIFDRIFADRAVNNLFTIKKGIEFCEREVPSVDNIKYPYDIAFNCVQVGNNLICNKKYTHSRIIEFAESMNMTIIDVKQGYTKCSTCVVSENAIITEDECIADNCKKHGIDVLKIDKGYVKLKGYDYGFIGGCCGLIEDDLLVFNGNINLHPNIYSISEFCKSRNVKIVSMCDEILYDVGSIIRI